MVKDFTVLIFLAEHVALQNGKMSTKLLFQNLNELGKYI
jgi:hypothetical protein